MCVSWCYHHDVDTIARIFWNNHLGIGSSEILGVIENHIQSRFGIGFITWVSPSFTFCPLSPVSYIGWIYSNDSVWELGIYFAIVLSINWGDLWLLLCTSATGGRWLGGTWTEQSLLGMAGMVILSVFLNGKPPLVYQYWIILKLLGWYSEALEVLTAF